MRIDIFSDIICPWCFIGKRRLERALAERPRRPIEIKWRAFLLNRDMPPEGLDRQEYLTLKFGGGAKARDLYGTIEQVGAGEGISFAFDRIQRTPNTVQAHRMVQFAGEFGRQDAMVESLFRAYFEDGRDLSDDRVLAAVAAEAGLDEGKANAMLSGGDGIDAVLAENDLAHEIGINGVPCFIVAERYAISGAQGPEVFSRLLDSLAQIDQGGDVRL